ncbi:MAG TPA: PEP/pyruvate-binding domain-containing protein, partial [Mobilitalea sp.]|nr:PEP/pyruvate-binding domain-containing protein [Mobilitalea sp.]
ILKPREGLKIHQLNAASGFESFTVQVHEIIEKEGYGAFYVFDCLSDLQSEWSTDLMMGNFFCVTCPYLFELDTVAYFPILRGHHDYATIARIQETTQLLLDIHSNDKEFYLHPIKVWNRYSPEMYLPHKLTSNNEFESLTNSIELASYYRLIHKEQVNHDEQNIDSYERFFKEAKASYYNGDISDKILKKISRSMMTHDHKMAAMIKEEFTPEDFFFIKERMIGTGTIGGKACGMLLSRKIIENHLSSVYSYLEPHDSFYIGSDIFYSYIVENKLWKLRISGRKKENYFSAGEELSKAILKGRFPQAIRDQFKRMLEYFGQIPIIVRSSSFLEDGFGNAFAGKYESIFCPNGFSPEERLDYFENAVRRVYASTMDQSALEYRRKRGMAEADEQMAILVQRVSGTKFGDYYMPCIAGVGFSYSIYRWSDVLNADAGLLRLVAGLGTKAVDRTSGDYPRMVNLDKPEVTTHTSDEDKHRFSQRLLDVINIKFNTFEELQASQLIPTLPKWYTNIICEHDISAESFLRERGQYESVQFVSCNGVVLKKNLMSFMKQILATLQQQYKTQVDIEYTINFAPDGTFVINLLQCRPLYVWQATVGQSLPKIATKNLFFEVYDSFMGNSPRINVDVVVYIDSKKYHQLPYRQKGIIAGIIGKVNHYYKDSGKNLMLISPGRIGTSSNELGVPVTFSDISNFKILCEYDDPAIGFVTELSYGSHMFQDLVESEMFYIAIMDKESTIFHKDFWTEKESSLKMLLPDVENPFNIVSVYEADSEKQLSLYADFNDKKTVCGYIE